MDPSSDITTADLSLDDLGRDLWDEVLPHLTSALAGDETAFLRALEAAGRGAGLVHRVPVAAVLDAYITGSEALCRLLAECHGLDAQMDAQHVHALEHAALTWIAEGYAGGQQETIERLRRLAEESSPVDHDSGAVKPVELSERLSLEVERCQRMDLPLGLVELAVEDGERERAAGTRTVAPMQQIGACLRDSLRRYDSVGLTKDGAFVLVLPDISRRGLAGAAERLRRRLGGCAGLRPASGFTFALAHYDFVDMSSTEMLASLDRGLRDAVADDRPLAWV